MPGMKPVFVNSIHNVAVVARGRVVAEISREVGGYRADAEGGEQGNQPNRERKFHAGPVG
jgi:hypothetical protein